MIGFFEHQYLSYKKSHLHNLILLAKADGNFHEDEEKLIYKIGERYGLKDRQIASLIISSKKRELHIPAKFEDKLNQMYDLLLMVYADGIVDKTEIKFCQNVAHQFGMKKEIVAWLLDFFKDGKRPSSEEWEGIVKKSEEEFLI